MRGRRGVLMSVFAVVVGMVVVGAGGVAANGQYRDPAERFAFQPPEGWMESRPTNLTRVTRLTDPRNEATFDLQLLALRGDVTLAQFTDGFISDARRNANYEQDSIGEARDATMGGVPAKAISYRFRSDTTTVSFTTYYALHRGTAYILNFGTLPGREEAVREAETLIVGSWQFLY